MHRILGLAALTLLGACQAAIIEPENPPLSVTFECEGAPGLSVLFYPEGGTANVAQLGLGQEVLYRQEAGSGYHYAAEGLDLRGQGDEVQWTVGGKTVTCQALGNQI